VVISSNKEELDPKVNIALASYQNPAGNTTTAMDLGLDTLKMIW
jgi:hypothetical protein